MPEKLLTIKEVAQYLGVSEEEVKRLVDIGEIPAYKIGDTFLRFRKEHIDVIKKDIDEVEAEHPELVEKAHADERGRVAHPYTDLELKIKSHNPSARQFDYSFVEKVKDFFYFYDFYIISVLIIFFLVFIILRY